MSPTIQHKRWPYPALRAWSKFNKMPDHRIDALIIHARKNNAPMWAIARCDNAWMRLDKDVPKDVEFYFAHHHPQLLDKAYKRLPLAA